MERLARTVSGHRSKWVVLALWIVVVVAGGTVSGKFESAQKNDPASFLPGSAESLKVLQAGREFASGTSTPAVVVYRRATGLTAGDRAKIAAARATIDARLPKGASAAAAPVFSRDGKAALLTVPIDAKNDSQVLQDAVGAIGKVVHADAGGGLAVAISGPAGFSNDAIKVFNGINGKLLLSTGLLVFVLLVLIYRSPVFWILPLLAVGFAESTTRALGYLIAKAGVVINGQAGGILLVLVFGAGTDYALLLTARYREELRLHEDRHEAMRIAVRRTAPTLLASGGTVIAGLSCLTLADVNGTAGLGPIGAVGVATALVSMLTLLPVVLLAGGRRAFWPFVPRFGSEAADETHGAWRRLGEWIERRHRAVAALALAGLVAGAFGLLTYDTKLTSANSFRGSVESVRGQRLLSQSFPGGTNAPTVVLVRDTSKLTAVRDAALTAPGVASIGPSESGPPGARFDVTLRHDPYSTAAFADIGPLREAVRAVGGSAAQVGGPTAEERDLRVSASRDTKLLVPIILAVIFLILIALLRALVAPVVLIATVILSFAASLGLSSLFFDWVFHFEGEDPGLLLFVFVFLVALGVDYNIFLMARVREETARHGTREGMLRGLGVTGSVITSAGVVLAGTFAVLAVLPLTPLTEVGFAVGLGVLLDTLVVRSVLVPAIVFELGGRTWLPSALARRARAAPPHFTSSR